MAYDPNKKATLGQLKALAVKAKSAIDTAIQDLPKEMFLDQAKTRFVSSFTFDATTYAGATDPDLNGKAVLVLAVKGIDNVTKAETTTYSFLDVNTLVNNYTVADNSTKVLNINGYTISFKISANDKNAVEVLDDGIAVRISSTENNALTKDANGLFVDISGKADRVTNSTAGNLAGLDANGNLTNSNIVAANVLTTADVATDTEANEMLDEVFGKAS